MPDLFPADWFWVADDGRVFNPKAGLLSTKHKLYNDYVGRRGMTTQWPRDGQGQQTEAALDEVLAPYGFRCSSLSIEEMRRTARAQVIAFADQMTERITGQYPAAEVASWPTQEAEARAIVAGAAAAPLISALATAAKMPLKDYATGVLAKAEAYLQVVAAVKAIRDTTDAAIDAATTPEAVGAALEQARQTALAKAAALGLA